MTIFAENYFMSLQFSDLGIHYELQERLIDLEITEPTEVQKKVIPFVLERKKDLVALAKTGTGKTVAFGLPLLQLINPEKNTIQAVILAPTRELGQQIYKNLITYAVGRFSNSIAGIFGGATIKSQIEAIKNEPSIVVATPGRLNDLIERGDIDIKRINYIVLDEADEMISALKVEVETILKGVPKTTRTLLFTATMSGAIKQLAQNYLSKNAVTIEADMSSVGHQGIQHQYVVVEPIEKLEVLLHFLSSREGERGVIFCKTKAAVNKLGKNLAKNRFSSGMLHGSLTQGIRDRVMGQFREGHINILVATDLAARGIDVKEISYVVHYHLPDTYEAYVHRSGRTARAGKEGLSLSVIQQEEVEEIPDFEDELGIVFTEFKKANPQSIEENNALLWARKIFKTKPNRTVSEELKSKVKKVFHHLTKEELIEKVLANHLAQNNQQKLNIEKSKKR